MYPIKFKPLYFEKPWGGRDFEAFSNDVPPGNIGERWDVACHFNGMSVVVNGEYQGIRLDELMKRTNKALLGTQVSPTYFPLLVKLIHAKEKLSVQVHPDDQYAHAVEGERGKTEAWYVVEAKEDATITVGLKQACTREEFRAAIEQGRLDRYLNELPVQKGDFFYIRSGTVHAIGAGVIIAEIQQNSDITYRVYDYNRGRELHVEKALDVIDFTLQGKEPDSEPVRYDGFSKQKLCSSRYFSLERYVIDTYCEEASDRERFFILTCVEGSGVIQSDSSSPEVSLHYGESILIPASLGKYAMIGRMNVLKSFVPV